MAVRFSGSQQGQAGSQVRGGTDPPAPVLAQLKCAGVPATRTPAISQMVGADSIRVFIQYRGLGARVGAGKGPGRRLQAMAEETG